MEVSLGGSLGWMKGARQSQGRKTQVALLMHKLSTTQLFSFISPISLFICMFCGPNTTSFSHMRSCFGRVPKSWPHHWLASSPFFPSVNFPWLPLSWFGAAIIFCAEFSLHFPQFFRMTCWNMSLIPDTELLQCRNCVWFMFSSLVLRIAWNIVDDKEIIHSEWMNEWTTSFPAMSFQ